MAITQSMQLPSMKWLPEWSISTRSKIDSVKNDEKNHAAWMVSYEIDHTTAYDILDQICKKTDLDPCVNQFKLKQDGRGKFSAIHARWLGPNYFDET